MRANETSPAVDLTTKRKQWEASQGSVRAAVVGRFVFCFTKSTANQRRFFVKASDVAVLRASRSTVRSGTVARKRSFTRASMKVGRNAHGKGFADV